MNTLFGKLGLVAAVAGVVLLGWGLWPLPQRTHAADIGAMQLVFTAPTAIRLGDAASARLEVLPATSAPAKGEGETPAVRQLAVRLNFNGAQVEPQGEVHLTLGQTAPVRLTWRVRPLDSDEDVGSLWVYQIFPDGSRLARLTYPLHLRVYTFLGLNGAEARLLGLFAVFVAMVLAFAARR